MDHVVLSTLILETSRKSGVGSRATRLVITKFIDEVFNNLLEGRRVIVNNYCVIKLHGPRVGFRTLNKAREEIDRLVGEHPVAKGLQPRVRNPTFWKKNPPHPPTNQL